MYESINVSLKNTVARTATVVRYVSPYLAVIAITIGLVNAVQYSQLQDQRAKDRVAADIQGCERGNARLAGQLAGNKEAIFGYGLEIIKRAPVLGINVDDPAVREELESAADEVFDQAYDDPGLNPFPCDQVIGASTTTSVP